MLLHDIGHMPYSHCTEFAMPWLEALQIRVYDPERVAARLRKRASHEDYTVGIITQSKLADVFNDFSFTAKHVAALISQDIRVDDDFFRDQSCDYRRLLSQLISSELDCDRMDYLVRDSYYTGARYGQIDVDWLLSNLRRHVDDEGNVSLAMNARALYAFDDFMIARYHMFVMVYFHHKSVVYEEMLRRFMSSKACDYNLPLDMNDVLPVDDTHLTAYLRAQDHPMAQRIVERVPYKRVLELHGKPEDVDISRHEEALKAADISIISASSTGRLSGYHGVGKKRQAAPPIYVIHEGRGRDPRVDPLENATHIFQRYQDERRINRIYVAPENSARAESILSEIRATAAFAM
jgi:HD superfamily phosphohydrolase